MISSPSSSKQLSTPSTVSTRKKLEFSFPGIQKRNTFCESSSESRQIYEDRAEELVNVGLTQSMFETYQVNALYHFSYEKLMHYQTMLAKNVKKFVLESPIEEYKSQKFIIEIEKFSEIAFTEKDSPALKITIMAEKNEGTRETYFTGFLLSIERKDDFMEEDKIKENAVLLPLLLVNYSNKIFLDSFFNFLEVNFTCVVLPLKFSTKELQWMFALFCFSGGNEENTRVCLLQYELPFEELTHITYSLHETLISETWEKVVSPDATEVTEDEVNEFFSYLEAYFYRVFSIRLSGLQLGSIKTPLAVVERNHSITAWKTSKIYFVLRHLTHLAQEIKSYM